mgnify:CR=1 FL=1
MGVVLGIESSCDETAAALVAHDRAIVAQATDLAHGTLLAAPKSERHQFGVIGHSFHDGGGEAKLKRAIADEGEAVLAFVVVTGIKGAGEAGAIPVGPLFQYAGSAAQVRDGHG